MNLPVNEIVCGSCLEIMRQWPDGLIDCCVTSPPYWGLRDYGVDGQLGLEKTPEEYVAKMVAIFAEVKRVLKPEGTLWLNLGDTYSSHKDCKSTPQSIAKGKPSEVSCVIEKGKSHSRNSKMLKSQGFKNKDLIGIPWMVAFALRQDGWYLRQDIIWHKPNPMPESVTDRCTKAHEYIFLMSKQPKYYCDMEAIREGDQVYTRKASGYKQEGQARPDGTMPYRGGGFADTDTTTIGRNKRSVWTVTTKPYSEAHFATFPPDLITPCILAGCPEGGIVLDPFMGSGTTAMVAYENRRNYVGCELNPEYIKLNRADIAKAKYGLFENK